MHAHFRQLHANFWPICLFYPVSEPPAPPFWANRPRFLCHVSWRSRFPGRSAAGVAAAAAVAAAALLFYPWMHARCVRSTQIFFSWFTTTERTYEYFYSFFFLALLLRNARTNTRTCILLIPFCYSDYFLHFLLLVARLASPPRMHVRLFVHAVGHFFRVPCPFYPETHVRLFVRVYYFFSSYIFYRNARTIIRTRIYFFISFP